MDFDNDGDLDLLCGEFLDGFTYYKNIGTRQTPEFSDGIRLRARMDLQMITPVVLDWDRDGDPDIICGDEDGRVALIENTGKFTDKDVPVFLNPRYFQRGSRGLVHLSHRLPSTGTMMEMRIYFVATLQATCYSCGEKPNWLSLYT